jgi:two-component system chemotaxis response regulator CheB
LPGKDIVVIGASAGGIPPIREILRALPGDFPGSIFIVVHVPSDSPGVLESIFDSSGALDARFASNRERIVPGRVYIAPPDHHLLIEPGRVRLTRGPRENRFRPAVDPLFRTAAQTYGPRVVGIVLSGGMDDGAAGLWTIRRLGGTAIVQSPAEAATPEMPLNAIRAADPDHVVAVSAIGNLLTRLAQMPADVPPGDVAVPEDVRIEASIAKEIEARHAGVTELGDPSLFTCPECHGVLLEVRAGRPKRYRCHTGHAYTQESLLADLDLKIEDALWSVIRALNEKEFLLRQLEGEEATAARQTHAAETRRRAELLLRAQLQERDEASSSDR